MIWSSRRAIRSSMLPSTCPSCRCCSRSSCRGGQRRHAWPHAQDLGAGSQAARVTLAAARWNGWHHKETEVQQLRCGTPLTGRAAGCRAARPARQGQGPPPNALRPQHPRAREPTGTHPFRTHVQLMEPLDLCSLRLLFLLLLRIVPPLPVELKDHHANAHLQQHVHDGGAHTTQAHLQLPGNSSATVPPTNCAAATWPGCPAPRQGHMAGALAPP